MLGGHSHSRRTKQGKPHTLGSSQQIHQGGHTATTNHRQLSEKHATPHKEDAHGLNQTTHAVRHEGSEGAGAETAQARSLAPTSSRLPETQVYHSPALFSCLWANSPGKGLSSTAALAVKLRFLESLLSASMAETRGSFHRAGATPHASAARRLSGRGVHHFVETTTREVTGGSLLTEWCSPITTYMAKGFAPTIIKFSHRAPAPPRLLV